MYLIRERFFRSDEHSNITDDQGRPVLQVDAKALSLRNRLVLRDPKGKEVAQVRRTLAAHRPTYEVSVDGQEALEIRKHLVTPFGETSLVELATDRDGSSKGFGFAEYGNDDHARARLVQFTDEDRFMATKN